jgi:hypothetical protein
LDEKSWLGIPRSGVRPEEKGKRCAVKRPRIVSSRSFGSIAALGFPSMSSRPTHAPIGRLRQWKIALSLAVVGALAAPFAFGTYKEVPTQLVRVPLTAHDKEQRANYLDTDDCNSFDFSDQLNEHFFCELENKEGTIQYFKRYMKEQLERGEKDERHADFSKYWMMNVGVAAATAASLFGLTFLIPMLIRGTAVLARRYWSWLKA